MTKTEGGDVEDGLTRLNRIDAEVGVAHTLSRYAHAIDYGDMEGLADCFLEDAVVFTNLPLGNLQGADAILEFYRGRPSAPEKFEKHCISNCLVTMVSATEASAKSFYFLIQDRPTGPFISHYGRYIDRLTRCQDGNWRFNTRYFEGEGIAPGMRATGQPHYRSAELVDNIAHSDGGSDRASTRTDEPRPG
jgi:hypothetical protein